MPEANKYVAHLHIRPKKRNVLFYCPNVNLSAGCVRICEGGVEKEADRFVTG